MQDFLTSFVKAWQVVYIVAYGDCRCGLLMQLGLAVHRESEPQDKETTCMEHSVKFRAGVQGLHGPSNGLIGNL